MSTEGSEDEGSLITPGEEWDRARLLLKPLNQPHPNFVAAVRGLIKAWSDNKSLQQGGAAFEARRFLLSRTVKATYYYMCKAYRPELLNEPDLGSTEPFVTNFSAFDHAAILGYLCMFRAMCKLSDKEEWSFIQEPFYDAIDHGAMVGQAIPKMGIGFGLLVRGVRCLCFAPFLWNSKKEFQLYRRHLKKNEIAFDLNWERRVWGCTTVELASILLQLTGFNFGVSESYYLAVTGAPARISKYHDRFENAERWIAAIMETGTGPEVGLHADFTLKDGELSKLLDRIHQLTTTDARIEWLNKGKGSISPAITPELFSREVAGPADDEDPPGTV